MASWGSITVHITPIWTDFVILVNSISMSDFSRMMLMMETLCWRELGQLFAFVARLIEVG
jgi:hypothetical protein